MTYRREKDSGLQWHFACKLALSLLVVINLYAYHTAYAQEPLPDLVVRPHLLPTPLPPHHVDQEVTWTIEIGNIGTANAENCKVRVFLGIPDTDRRKQLLSTTIPQLNTGGSFPVSVKYTFAEEDFGRRNLSAEVDFGNKMKEIDENNNHSRFANIWLKAQIGGWHWEVNRVY